MDLITWVDSHEGTVMSVLTLVYVIATILILRANRISIKEMKKTREEENRPYIIIYFEIKNNGLVNLVVENIGKTLAKDTKIQITPKITYPKSMPLSQSNLLNEKIPDIPPGYKYKGFVESLSQLKKENDEYPVFTANVTYLDSIYKNKYKENYILNLNVQSGLLSLREKDIHDLVKDFNKFKKVMLEQTKIMNLNLEKIQDKR